MNKKLKKTLKRTGIGATGFLAFAGALVGGYLLTPNRTSLIDVSVQEREKTLFERFVEKLTKDVGIDEEEESAEAEVESYLSAKLVGLTSGEKFNITYKKDKESSFTNTINVNSGEIDFRMSALAMSAIEFNVDLDVDYNGRNVPLTLGHFGNEIYFRLKDMKMKMTDFKAENLSTKYLLAFAAYANLNTETLFNDLGTLINDKLGSLFDGLISGEISLGASKAKDDQPAAEEEEGFDFSSLLSNAPKETARGGDTVFSYGETEKENGLLINLVADEDLSLKRVELENISFGTVTINGAIDVEVKKYEEFVSPALDGYFEVFNYTSLTGKLLSVLKEGNQKFGLNFSLDLNDVQDEVTTDIAKVNGSINVDFDKLLDLSQYATEQDIELERDTSLIVGDFKDVGFNLQLDLLGQNDVEYANLDLVFADGKGYLRFNEQDDGNGGKDSVMKLYFDPDTMNWITSKVPELIDGLSQDSGTDTMETLSKFLSEDLVDSINNFDFSFILDMLKTLKNDKDGFELGIDLSALNIGENAEVVIRVDNDSDYFQDYFDLEDIIMTLNDKASRTPEEEEQLNNAIASFQEKMSTINDSGLDIDIGGLAFGNFTLDANMRTAPFSAPELGDHETYQSTRFIPDVVEQVTDLIDTKKTGFSLSGSMLDNDNLGIRFAGQGCLNNTEEVKEGFGEMHIDQYKYSGNQVWARHDMYVNVTNLAANIQEIEVEDSEGNIVKKKNNQNEALFIYGDPDDNDNNVKGKMKLQTFSDLIDVVMTFINEEGSNPKYTKFLAPITKVLGMNTLGSIIESKDYLYLASNNLLKKINVIENAEGTEIQIVINKNMFGMNLPSDIALSINTKYNEEGKQRLHSLVINDLVLSDKENASKLNLTFELEEYNNGTQNRIHKGDNFMSLDGIKTLLQLGINTTKVNFYHLTAEALIRLGSTSIIKPDLQGINFYVYVDGVHVKVYGTIDKIPTVVAITVDDALGLKNMAADFSFETYGDDNDDKVGGIFNVRRYFKSDDTERVHVGFLKWETRYYHVKDCYHYRCDSENFLDNIAQYLITGLIGIKPSIYLDALNQENSGTSEYKEPGKFTNTFTSTGFQSYKQNGNDVIKLGLNLNELTGINALKEVEATITSQHINYEGSSKGLDVLGSLHATLRVNFATIFNINITLDAAVAEAVVPQAQALTRWNAKASEGFNEITSHTIADANYNNPNNPATYQIRTQYWK